MCFAQEARETRKPLNRLGLKVSLESKKLKSEMRFNFKNALGEFIDFTSLKTCSAVFFTCSVNSKRGLAISGVSFSICALVCARDCSNASKAEAFFLFVSIICGVSAIACSKRSICSCSGVISVGRSRDAWLEGEGEGVRVLEWLTEGTGVALSVEMSGGGPFKAIFHSSNWRMTSVLLYI